MHYFPSWTIKWKALNLLRECVRKFMFEHNNVNYARQLQEGL